MSQRKNSDLFLIQKVEKFSGSNYSNTNLFISEEKEFNTRVSAFSKVNFSKLTEYEKDIRLKNLSNLVYRLKRRIERIQFKDKSTKSSQIKKLLSKHVEEIDNFNFENLTNALKILKNFPEHSFEDEKNLIKNFIYLIADEKLSPSSINFKKICSQVRMFVDRSKINYISKNGNSIQYSFNDKNVYITPREYDYYIKYKNKEKIMNCIFGIRSVNNIYPNIVSYNSKDKLNDRVYQKKSNDFLDLQHKNNIETYKYPLNSENVNLRNCMKNANI
jgi:hypothetical protein